MCPRSHVLLRLSLAPQGYLSLSPLHVLLGCVGEKVQGCLTIPEQLYVPLSPLHFRALPKANIWSQSRQRRPQGPGTRR